MSPERRARGAVGVTFFLNGLIYGSLAARMPAIREHAGVDNGQLGLALACVALGAVLAMPVAGMLSARHGSRPATRAALVVACVAVVLPSLATSLPALAASFLVLGVSIGSLDVAMNAHGVAVERAYDRPILSGFHAAFSFGGLAGAGSAALVASAGIDVRAHLAAVALVSLVIGVVWTRRFLPAHADASGGGEPVLVRPPRRLWALGALAFACLLIEGAAADWSAVYVHDDLGAGAGVAALAYTAFSLTMGVGRLYGDRLVDRFGPEALVRVGGAVAGAGFALALALDHPAAAFFGFAALGAGMSVVVPVVFRAAGNTPGMPSGVALAAVSSTGYLGFVAGPPMIGGLAELTGLPNALATLVVLGLVVAALASATAPVGRRATAEVVGR